MEEIFQHFRMLLINFAASAIFFVTTAVYLLSSGLMGIAFFEIRAPVICSAAVGAVIAGIHGSTMGVFLMWKKSDLLLMSITASILSMEIIALLICLGLLLLEWSARDSRLAGSKVFFAHIEMLFILAGIFLCISALLFVPALLIGLVNHYFQSLFR